VISGRRGKEYISWCYTCLKMNLQNTRPQSFNQAATHKRLWDKIAVETPEGVFTTDKEDRAVELMRKFQKKYPGSPPTISYLPRGDVMQVH
jgi:hypothetical protein